MTPYTPCTSFSIKVIQFAQPCSNENSNYKNFSTHKIPLSLVVVTSPCYHSTFIHFILAFYSCSLQPCPWMPIHGTFKHIIQHTYHHHYQWGKNFSTRIFSGETKTILQGKKRRCKILHSHDHYHFYRRQPINISHFQAFFFNVYHIILVTFYSTLNFVHFSMMINYQKPTERKMIVVIMMMLQLVYFMLIFIACMHVWPSLHQNAYYCLLRG